MWLYSDSKAFWYSSEVMARRHSVQEARMVATSPQNRPFRCTLSLGNRKKFLGAKSGQWRRGMVDPQDLIFDEMMLDNVRQICGSIVIQLTMIQAPCTWTVCAEFDVWDVL